MANGAKFSQVGVDISRASDHELHFNSQWPTVHSLKSGSTTNTTGGADHRFYKHGLGFIPAFIPYIYDSISGEFEIFRAIMAADKEYIYWYSGGGTSISADKTYGLEIFNIDLEKNYVAPNINPDSTSVGGDETTNFGISVVFDGAKINSGDMQDFKINTSGRAPLVHAVSVGEATEPSYSSGVRNYSYTHTLPYNPMFIPYVEMSSDPGKFTIIANFAGTNAVNNIITLVGIQAGLRGCIVVLKDPFDASENTTNLTL